MLFLTILNLFNAGKKREEKKYVLSTEGFGAKPPESLFRNRSGEEKTAALYLETSYWNRGEKKMIKTFQRGLKYV